MPRACGFGVPQKNVAVLLHSDMQTFTFPRAAALCKKFTSEAAAQGAESCMAVTIKDVAREARVSVASVSRALNGSANVTEITRRRIIGVAERLRYVPHSAARSLITRRTQTVGALLPDLFGEFFSELIRGIDLAARARGLAFAGFEFARTSVRSGRCAARDAGSRRWRAGDVAARRCRVSFRTSFAVRCPRC